MAKPAARKGQPDGQTEKVDGAEAATVVTSAAISPAGRRIAKEIALRGGAIIARKILGKPLTGKGLAVGLAKAAVARIGFKALPGSLVVGGIMLAKMVYDHKRASKAKKHPPQK